MSAWTCGPGEILGLVGESGSGKTTTALVRCSATGERGVLAAQGDIEISGQPLASEQAFRGARGRLVSYVPQNPGQSLNPSLRVAAAVEDMLRAHQGQPGGQRGRGGAAGPGRAAVGAGVRAAVSAPAVRRPAAAGVHRGGAGVRA